MKQDLNDPAAMLRALCCPAACPWEPSSVEMIETHISWVFLAGDRVVKIKRPVDYGFVDQTALVTRRRLCRDEVALNRRLTSGVYLDAVPIVRGADGYRVGGDGEAVEWATLMRRLPADRMLDALLEAGKAPPDLADLLARRLIPFHRDTAGDCAASPTGSVAATTAVVTENLDQLVPFAGSILPPRHLAIVETAVRAYAREEQESLARREAAGWIRDGHGDLRAEHICLEPDGAVQVFDCVEFSRAIRCADVASDLAFLLMDLDRLGAGEVAADLLARYRAAGFDLPAALVRFYAAHRALVRAKVACLSRANADPTRALALADEASWYLGQATRSAVTVRPCLIAMTGLSGTGKSTVAQTIGHTTGAPVVASDRVRKELAGIVGPAPAGWQEGAYGPAWTERTYRRLTELARETLARNQPVVLDATFLDPLQRRLVAETAARAGVAAVFVETICDEPVVAARIAARQARADSPSDADLEVHGRQRAALAADPVPVPMGAVAIQIDTAPDGPIDLDPLLTALATKDILASMIPLTEPYPAR